MGTKETSTTKASRRAACFYVGENYDMAGSMGHLLFQLLGTVRREVESRMAELAREMNIDAGAMTRMLDRLAAKGLVERVRSETDRRVVHLRITREGDAAAEQVPHVLAAVNNDFLRGFTKQEWMQMKNFLQRMLVNGQALQEQAEETQ